jgi:hypothetical protein
MEVKNYTGCYDQDGVDGPDGPTGEEAKRPLAIPGNRKQRRADASKARKLAAEIRRQERALIAYAARKDARNVS